MERPCVYLGVGMQRWTCVAVSTYPAHGPGRVNGAGAGLLWRAFCFPPPPMSHQKRLGSVLLQPLGSSTSILTRRPAIAHRPPPSPSTLSGISAIPPALCGKRAA